MQKPAFIKPTVGRVVWLYVYGKTQLDANEQPQAAFIAYVHSDRCVNLTVLAHDGTPYAATEVQLVQDGEDPPAHQFCTWMPYQKGQAAKTEQLEKRLQNNQTLLDAGAKGELA